MDKNHHEGGHFTNGFLFGLIIGAAIVFFLFTDKGKKLLKTITEEGIESFSDLKELVGEEMDDDEENEEMEKRKEEKNTPSKVKRFFKGIRK